MLSHPESHGEQYAMRFADQSVVDRYHLRPTYPPETFKILNTLIRDEPRAVLDVGCGTGNISRPLAKYVERIDAVDWSCPMLERARTLPGGDSPKIRWLHGRAEDVETQPPYALVTAGESLHWMDWGVILPRFAHLVTPQGVLAIVYIVDQPVPWRDGYRQIVRRFTNNPTYVPIAMIAELEKYQLFQKLGECKTAAVSVGRGSNVPVPLAARTQRAPFPRCAGRTRAPLSTPLPVKSDRPGPRDAPPWWKRRDARSAAPS